MRRRLSEGVEVMTSKIPGVPLLCVLAIMPLITGCGPKPTNWKLKAVADRRVCRLGDKVTVRYELDTAPKGREETPVYLGRTWLLVRIVDSRGAWAYVVPNGDVLSEVKTREMSVKELGFPLTPRQKNGSVTIHTGKLAGGAGIYKIEAFAAYERGGGLSTEIFEASPLALEVRD
jgi:hypothetical protein